MPEDIARESIPRRLFYFVLSTDLVEEQPEQVLPGRLYVSFWLQFGPPALPHVPR